MKKFCTKCKKFKCIGDFYKNCQKKDGLQSGCKKCHDRSNKKWLENNKDKARATTKKWYVANRDYVRKRLRKQRQELKRKIMKKYGDSCSCCGETNYKFLTIDHINQDGNRERKTTKRAQGFDLYRKLMDLPIRKDLQILCWNCNLGRYNNGGICPHKE